MAQSTLAGLETTGTTDEPCEDCTALPEGWPCADCFINGDREITADA
jgi:hypothetical protein